MSVISAAAVDGARGGLTYGRSRLYLGMSGVGLFVVLAAVGLGFGLPARLSSGSIEAGVLEVVGSLGVFVGLYAAVHVVLDVFGGYVLPRRAGRRHERFAVFAGLLVRGVVVHSAVLLVSGVVLTFAMRWAGVVGAVAAAGVLMMVLLAGRLGLARLMAPLGVESEGRGSGVVMVRSRDEGFTGNVLGVVRGRGTVLPAHWEEKLGREGFAVAAARRRAAVETGAWLRGRVLAAVFTVVGVGVSAGLVGAFGSPMGSVAGTIELSLWFTLWSFVGLLVLPTPSRRGVMLVDGAVRERFGEAVSDAASGTDRLQDDEPVRPGVVEAIFHPLPSASRRSRGDGSLRFGCWDAARTAVYLSAAGSGLLGRAVHCNSGRPALWVFLPCD